MNEIRRRSRRILVVVGIMIPIALLHFVTGSHYWGPYPRFVNGYLLDILIPFGFYFLLSLIDAALLESWIVKGLLVFGAASAVEIAQLFGLAVLGRTFDPADLLMYGIGVSLAVVLDTVVFPRLFRFWTPEARSSKRQIGGEWDA